MTKTSRAAAGAAVALALSAIIAASCQRTLPAPPATAAADQFHTSDPAVIASTGRPQLLEFFTPT